MTQDEDWIGSARPAPPSPALRERVLAAARTTPPRPARGLVDRMWESRGVRWGWALLVSILVIGHLSTARSARPSPPRASTAESRTPEPGSDEAALSAIEAAWAKARPQPPAPRVVDMLFDPSRARSLLQEVER